MVAEIISVGTELLLGNIVNTNAQYIAKEMARLGIDLYYQSVVGDNEERLSNVLKTALERSDLIITTGGLGPTKDDLTKEVAASYFGKQLIFDEKTYQHVKKRLESYGIIMAQGNKAVIMLPGPPKEMKALFAECSRLYIRCLSDHVFVSINIKVKGPDEMPLSVIGEAPIADQLGDILDSENPTVATYAKEDGVLIRVTASGKTREDALLLMKPVVTKIAEILADKIAWVKEDA